MIRFSLLLLLAAVTASCTPKNAEIKDLPPIYEEKPDMPGPGATDKVVVGYVTSWSSHEVKPEYVTHINYAFGHVDLGGIKYDNYIAETCSGLVRVEDSAHPVMEGIGTGFIIPDDEWYTYDKSPREAPYVHVIANVDEDSYTSPVKMGDHPVIWTNTSVKARNVYFLFGHSPKLMDTPEYKQMLLNTIEWITNR